MSTAPRQFREIRRFCPTGKSVKSCLVPFEKIFLFFRTANQLSNFSRPTRDRGVSRSSRTRDGMRWTRAASGMRKRAGRKRWLRTAKSCGPGAATLASSSRNPISRMTVAKEAAHRGEHEVSRKAIAQGVPGVPVNLYTRVLCSTHYLGTRGRGCSGHPALPCALSLLRGAT